MLAFPGVFKGALEVRARTINEEMKLAAAHAIATVIPENELLADYMITSVFNRHAAKSVAHAVADAALTSGAARRATGIRTPAAGSRRRADPHPMCSQARCRLGASGRAFCADRALGSWMQR